MVTGRIEPCITFLHNVLGNHFAVFAAALQSLYVLRGNIFSGCMFPFPAWIAFNWLFRSWTPFFPAKHFFHLTEKSSFYMSDAPSPQDFSKIFSLPSSESLVQSPYPESLSRKFSPRACLKLGSDTDDRYWISPSPTKEISDAVLFVFLWAESSQNTRDGAIFSKNGTFVFFDKANATIKMALGYGLHPRLWLLFYGKKPTPILKNRSFLKRVLYNPLTRQYLSSTWKAWYKEAELGQNVVITCLLWFL